MSINIAVVPVAGLGTRLLPATKSQPKEMLPVGRKPVVQYVVDELTRVGIERILFVTGPGKTSIENHFDVNAELIQLLREAAKRTCWPSSIRTRAGTLLLHAPASAARPGARQSPVAGSFRRRPAFRGGARATPSSA